MKKLIVVVVCALVMAAGSALLAQGSIRLVPRPAQGVTFAQPWTPAGSTGADTRVIGTIIDIGQSPVAHAKVQLRSLVTGTVQQGAESNENGEYEFNVETPGTYVVEMTMVDGYVVALSNAGALARYETLRTMVQLPGIWDSRLRRMVIPQSPTSFLGISAQNSMTATTLSMAVDLNIRPVNSGEPVSATATAQQ